jgi:hypothetical protein
MPWQADGIQRDGPEVRATFDAMLRRWLDASTFRSIEAAGTLAERIAAVTGELALL